MRMHPCLSCVAWTRAWAIHGCVHVSHERCVRQVCVQVSQEMRVSEFWSKRVVLVAAFIQGVGLLRRMPHDWGVSNTASACSNLNICLFQFVLCSNKTRSTLD